MVSLDFLVAVVTPVGETVVPLEFDAAVLVTTPLTLVVFSLLLSTDATGAGMTGVVVVCVVVELEDKDCAKAPPVIRVTAIVAASMVLIMSNSPGDEGGAGIARLGAVLRDIDGLMAASETTQSPPSVLPVPTAIITVAVILAMLIATIAAARLEDAPGQRERNQ